MVIIFSCLYQYHSLILKYFSGQMKQTKVQKQNNIQSILDSYCQVCFVPFNKQVPRKLEEGEEILNCVQCNCRVHKCCYDLEANSSFITNRVREFVCQRCEKKQLVDKGCIICHRKEGALKVIGGNQLIHVFCGLMHKDIYVTGYFPQLSFKKTESYKDVRNVCGLCSKPNATQQCISDSCFKRFHGYCILLNLKARQLVEDEPQCQKFYISHGDNGKFDLSEQIMPRSWLYEQFDRVLATFEEQGFQMPQKQKQKIKNQVYQAYEKEQKENRDQTKLKRGGFAYILCKDHESSVYCNCFNHGTGDMVQCECCFEWYHQKCVNYEPNKNQQHYICIYCHNFYDLKKKIIDEVRSSKTQHYQLKFQPPKMHINDFIWLMRVIDHRIAGGAASKMLKQLAKYPLKTSKMDIMLRNQNKKKITNIAEAFIQKYLESPEHQNLVKPKPVLGIDFEQKPLVLQRNVEHNKNLKAYVDFIQNYVRKNCLPDYFGPLVQELKFKERAVEDQYETILQLSKSQKGYPQIPILKMKVEEYSFMEVLKNLDSGSMIQFEDLESAVEKTKNSSNVPPYLLKPLIQRYKKVKNLVQLVSKHIHQKKQTSPQIQDAIKKLNEEKILPPQIYKNFHEQKKFIKDLYLFYLKQVGKPIQSPNLNIQDKIKILVKEPVCQPNTDIAQCVNSLNLEGKPVHDNIAEIIEKYSKTCLAYELKEYLKKKSIKLSALENLYTKYKKLEMDDLDEDISNLMQTWRKIREIWIETKKRVEASIDELDDIDGLTTEIKHIQETIQYLNDLPLEIADKAEEVPELGSVNRLQQLKNWLDTLIILFTESQLKKNPFTISKLPEGLPKQNPLVKQYVALKKQHNELMAKYNAIYTRINEKIQLLKADPKKPRKQQMKQNAQKPRLTDVNNFIQTLQQSKINMQRQIKQLTKTVNKTIEISSKVNKFIQSQKHHESMFKEDQIDAVKKQIDQLRKRVLTEAEISLQNQLKELYIAEICIRMQKMIITSNAELDKMSKLLKFAQEEGLNNLQTYKRLKSKFEIGNQSTKQINLTKKHQQHLNNQALKLKESDIFYTSLVYVRKSLPLSIPQILKQKNKHYEDLLTRNQYLRKKIQFILNEQPKKYQIDEAKVTYLQALKHPFEIEGLSKLIYQFQKAQQLINQWKQNREIEDSNDRLLITYDSLIFHIEQIEALRRSIQEIENITQKVRQLRKNDLSLDSLCKVQESLQAVEQNTVSKSTKIYSKFKLEYYYFWMKLLQKFKQEQTQAIPFSKIKSILIDIYNSIQRNLRSNPNANEDLKHVVSFFEDIMLGIRNAFQQKKQKIQPIFEGYIDIEELKYQILSGTDVKDQTKILNPFNDLNRFYTLDLQKTHSRQSDDLNALRKQRTQMSIQMQDPYIRETKLQRSHKSIGSQSKIQDNDSVDKKVEEWQKDEGGFVSEAQRNKAKQVLLKNIKKNPELANYQNLSQQIRMIQNQLFGDHHNQVFKYFELVNSFEKLFIKLISCPNISAKIVKKNFQWDFLKLLISNLQQINQLEQMIVQKNKQTAVTSIIQKKIQKRESKQVAKQQKQREAKKQGVKAKEKTIQQMIAIGEIDDEIRNKMKKEIKVIRDKNRKKKHRSSRRRSRSRSYSSSRSPEAKFSSDSQENKLPVFIQKQYNQTVDKPYFSDLYIPNIVTSAPLLYDPDLQEENLELQKKTFPKGAILQLRPMELEVIIRKKAKPLIKLKTFLMTTEDYSKISAQLIDPGFSNLQLKKDKDELEIIQYLNKPSRKKYKFLVGWFEAEDRQTTELIRDFASECNERKKIYGFQNDHIKVHIMSIHQYVKILQLYEPPSKVSTQMAAQVFKKERLIYILQYPSEKMYELKGIYENFNNVIAKDSSYEVVVPQPAPILPPIEKTTFGNNQFAINFNPLVPAEPIKPPIDINPLKPVVYQDWGAVQTATNYTLPTGYSQNFNPLNSLSRFSPIMTDEQDYNGDQYNKEKVQSHEKQIDLASNILNSLADVNIKPQPISRNYPQQTHPAEEQPVRYDSYNRYQPQQVPVNVHQRWQQPGMMPPPQMHMNRMNMPYNPMSMAPKFAPPSNPPSMMYKNPMMAMNPYNYSMPPPPPGQQNQPKPPGNQGYDPYMYQRQ